MTPAQLFDQIQAKQSLLCVGLDTDPARIPTHLQKEADPIFAFNKAIIDATLEFAVAYKPNIAFYEALGPKGWESLRKVTAVSSDFIVSCPGSKSAPGYFGGALGALFACALTIFLETDIGKMSQDLQLNKLIFIYYFRSSYTA